MSMTGSGLRVAEVSWDFLREICGLGESEKEVGLFGLEGRGKRRCVGRRTQGVIIETAI